MQSLIFLIYMGAHPHNINQSTKAHQFLKQTATTTKIYARLAVLDVTGSTALTPFTVPNFFPFSYVHSPSHDLLTTFQKVTSCLVRTQKKNP